MKKVVLEMHSSSETENGESSHSPIFSDDASDVEKTAEVQHKSKKSKKKNKKKNKSGQKKVTGDATPLLGKD